MLQKKIISLFLCFLLTFSTFAQIDSKPEKPEKNISPEAKEKALSLLNGLVREAEQFSLPKNRIAARLGVANLLWENDEKAARIIFQNAISELGGMTTAIPPENADSGEDYNTDRYLLIYDVTNLRKELLFTLAARDAKFALEALQSLSIKDAEGNSIFGDDTAFELELAAKVADNEPKQAYQIAKRNLENGFNANVLAALENLYRKDAELGVKFAQDILNKIKRKETVITPSASSAANSNSNIANSNSQDIISPVNVWEIQQFADSVKKLNRQAAGNKKIPVLSESDMKELIDILVQKYLKQDHLSFYEVSKIMPEITKYFPASAQAIRRKIGQQESATFNNLIKNKSFQDETEDKAAEEILQIIEKKPAAERDEFYYQAAETAFNNGEIEAAKTFHGKIKTKREYDYLEKGISDALPLALAEKGDLHEVRQILAKLKTPEERIEVLTALAMSVAKSGDKKTASALINEARSVYSGRMKNRRNLTSVFQMAQSYSIIEPDQSFSLLESNTQFFNDVIGAAILLDDFNESGAVENDELKLDAVRRASYQNMPKGVALLKNLTAADFDRTISLAERFARPEVRFYARFRIAEALLDSNAEENEKNLQKTFDEEEHGH